MARKVTRILVARPRAAAGALPFRAGHRAGTVSRALEARRRVARTNDCHYEWLMELRDLGYFLACIDDGNVTRAARRIHAAQPTLSHAIRRLEDEAGTRLLERR